MTRILTLDSLMLVTFIAAWTTQENIETIVYLKEQCKFEQQNAFFGEMDAREYCGEKSQRKKFR